MMTCELLQRSSEGREGQTGQTTLSSKWTSICTKHPPTTHHHHHFFIIATTYTQSCARDFSTDSGEEGQGSNRSHRAQTEAGVLGGVEKKHTLQARTHTQHTRAFASFG